MLRFVCILSGPLPLRHSRSELSRECCLGVLESFGVLARRAEADFPQDSRIRWHYARSP